jgi:hypothetical protein
VTAQRERVALNFFQSERRVVAPWQNIYVALDGYGWMDERTDGLADGRKALLKMTSNPARTHINCRILSPRRLAQKKESERLLRVGQKASISLHRETEMSTDVKASAHHDICNPRHVGENWVEICRRAFKSSIDMLGKGYWFSSDKNYWQKMMKLDSNICRVKTKSTWLNVLCQKKLAEK